MNISFYKDGKVRQLYAGFTGGLSLFIAGMWSGWSSSFLLQLKRGELGFNLTTSEQSWVVSLSDVGNVVSPLPTGFLMDAYGRKSTLMLTAVVYQISWILAVIGDNVYLLYSARFLSGVGNGIGYSICPMYLAEIADTKIRGAVSGLFTVMIFSGTLIEFGFGSFLTVKYINVVSSVVPLIFFVLLLSIPESPYYLLMKGNDSRAQRSHSWLKGSKQEGDAVSSTELETMKYHVKKEMESRGRWVDLINKSGVRRATLIVLTVNAMQRLGGISTMLSYMSTSLPTGHGVFGPENCMIMFASLLLTTSLVCMFIVDWIGRRPTLLVSSMVCTVLQAMTAVYFYLEATPGFDVTGLQWIPYASTLTFPVFYQMGLGIMPHTLLGEMFPTNVKSKAAASATICAGAATFLVNKIFPIVSKTYGVYFMFIIFCIVNGLASVFTFIFVIETKGKTFPEIQDILNRVTS